MIIMYVRVCICHTYRYTEHTRGRIPKSVVALFLPTQMGPAQCLTGAKTNGEHVLEDMDTGSHGSELKPDTISKTNKLSIASCSHPVLGYSPLQLAPYFRL